MARTDERGGTPAVLDAARAVAEDIDRAVEAQNEVERLLRAT